MRVDRGFQGSNFDDGDWIGHEGTATWSHGVNEWHLKDEDKEKVLGSSEVENQDNLRDSGDKGALTDTKKLKYIQIFYWRHRVDPNIPWTLCPSCAGDA